MPAPIFSRPKKRTGYLAIRDPEAGPGELMGRERVGDEERIVRRGVAGGAPDVMEWELPTQYQQTTAQGLSPEAAMGLKRAQQPLRPGMAPTPVAAGVELPGGGYAFSSKRFERTPYQGYFGAGKEATSRAKQAYGAFQERTRLGRERFRRGERTRLSAPVASRQQAEQEFAQEREDERTAARLLMGQQARIPKFHTGPGGERVATLGKSIVQLKPKAGEPGEGPVMSEDGQFYRDPSSTQWKPIPKKQESFADILKAQQQAPLRDELGKLETKYQEDIGALARGDKRDWLRSREKRAQSNLKKINTLREQLGLEPMAIPGTQEEAIAQTAPAPAAAAAPAAGGAVTREAARAELARRRAAEAAAAEAAAAEYYPEGRGAPEYGGYVPGGEAGYQSNVPEVAALMGGGPPVAAAAKGTRRQRTAKDVMERLFTPR